MCPYTEPDWPATMCTWWETYTLQGLKSHENRGKLHHPETEITRNQTTIYGAGAQSLPNRTVHAFSGECKPEMVDAIIAYSD